MLRTICTPYPFTVRISDAPENETFFVREIGHSCPPAGAVRNHVLSPRYDIHFVTRGCGSYNGERIDASCGFLIAVNEPYTYHFDDADPWEHYWISVGGSKAPEVLASMGMMPHNHVFPCDFLRELRGDFDRVLDDTQMRVDYDVYMTSIFYRMMAYYAARHEQSDQISRAQRTCNAAVQFIQDNYFSLISVDDIAAAANISSKYLYKLFMASIGMSPSAYLADYRMERAKQLLTETTLPVCDIAEAVGYDQANYFSSIFRRHFGVSPTEYRGKREGEAK